MTQTSTEPAAANALTKPPQAGSSDVTITLFKRARPGSQRRLAAAFQDTTNDDAADRLAIIAGFFSVLFVVVILSDVFLADFFGWRAHRPPNALQLTHLGLSFGVFVIARRRLLRGSAVVALAVVYVILGALLIALGDFAHHTLMGESPLRVSWLAVWITMLPLVIPASPTFNIVTAFISASLPWLVWFFTTDQFQTPTRSALFNTFVPYYWAALHAFLPATIVFSLRRRASDAQKSARELGSYRLVRELGRGGMGEVWEAQHRMLARPAAIKLVSRERGADRATNSDALLSRFGREAQAIAALTSPHTVSLYDFGLSESGELYYVMELLVGIDLDTLVRRFGPVCPARAVHFLLQACESLAEAHDAGMIHRDVKPANLYACRIGRSRDFVKVLDFGLVAKAAAFESRPDLTLEGQVVGTPAFMSPEQARGTKVDSRADLYALGCVAYWLLTGEHVFPSATSIESLADHIHRSPTPPSRRTVQEIPPALDRLILRCLAKDPADRPQSADALASELRLCLDRSDGESWSERDASIWWNEHLNDLKPEKRDWAEPSPAALVRA